jgi:8-oxo-dGTP pyrophosphatase MutT (NUDIX family)
MTFTHRVRGIVTKDFSSILLIKRARPGVAPYWVFPGGGIEQYDANAEAALLRELAEEIGAEVEVLKLAFDFERQTASDTTTRESFYLCRLLNQNLNSRTGPEFGDPSRGTYDLEWIPVQIKTLEATNIKPDELKSFMLAHCADLASLPDLR